MSPPRVQTPFLRIAALLINYRTPRLTLNCLDSLSAERSAGPPLDAFVVDNASGDGSVEQIAAAIGERGWESWVRVTGLPRNGGFSAGNNAAITAARAGDYDAYLLINSDTVVRPGALAELSSAFLRPEIGLAGPGLEWPSGEGQVSCFRNVSPGSEFVTAAKTGPISRRLPGYEIPMPDPMPGSEIEWISFACVLIRRAVVEAIGPMDEGFFMYFEDVDYCRRARAAGWQIAYVPEARVVHLRGDQGPQAFAESERKRRPAFYYRSRARYMARYYGRTGPLRANLLWLAGRGISLVRELAGNKRPHAAACEARDIWKGALCGFGSGVAERSTTASSTNLHP
jgi:GT2 family glycosyltransferase